MKESDLYQDVKNWLYDYLKSHYKTAEIIVEDTHNIKLSDFIFRKGLTDKFPHYRVFDIKTDITGVITRKNQLSTLVFVECKITKITLTNVGQLLGYSIVADPVLSFLISPKGISRSLFNLLHKYNRYDVLFYEKDNNKRIRIVSWVVSRKEPLWEAEYPPYIQGH